MFVDNKVMKEIDGEKRYDKFALASTIFAVSFEGATCSLLESQVLNNCDNCNLRPLCKKIDGIIENYTEATTRIVQTFRV
jgi:hypothetical protein